MFCKYCAARIISAISSQIRRPQVSLEKRASLVFADSATHFKEKSWHMMPRLCLFVRLKRLSLIPLFGPTWTALHWALCQSTNLRHLFKWHLTWVSSLAACAHQITFQTTPPSHLTPLPSQRTESRRRLDVERNPFWQSNPQILIPPALKLTTGLLKIESSGTPFLCLLTRSFQCS